MEEDLLKKRHHHRVETDSIETVFNCVIPYINATDDRNSASLVCRKWYDIDRLTRKHVSIPISYAITPSRLHQRFPNLESLTLKGKPEAPIFDTVPHNWGGHVAPWVQEICNSFNHLKSIHFKRMIVSDSELELLAKTRGEQIRVLKINHCFGFSTDGLLHISTHCNNLKDLFLQNSLIFEVDGKWLHELALRNTAIESLNYHLTTLFSCDHKDLVLIAKNCSESLVSLKVTECDVGDLVDVFKYAINLEAFAGAWLNKDPDQLIPAVKFPPKLGCMAMDYMSLTYIPVVLPVAHQLTELNLMYARFNADVHCVLIYKCPNLEVLYTRDIIGDHGMDVISCFCTKLRRITIEKGPRDDELISHTGLISLARGCLELEYIHIYVKDIENEALECIGTHLKKLIDFRIISLQKLEKITDDSTLDDGFRALLTGCTNLERLGIYFRPGVLSDVGLGYIGEYGQNLKSLFLGYIGEVNDGLVELSKGCPKLKKFEMRGCYLSEDAVTEFVMNATSLRYLWVQGHRLTATDSDSDSDSDDSDSFEHGFDVFGGGGDIWAMTRPFWNMELIECEVDAEFEPVGSFPMQPFSLLAYYSLAGQRTDFPDSVTPLHPLMDF